MNPTMNREIKFKYIFKLQSGNLLKEVLTLEDIEGGMVGNIYMGQDHDQDPVEEIIARCEFTNLKDKKGVEIYEGDIVSFEGNITTDNSLGSSPNGWVLDETSKYSVEWSKEWGAWQPSFTEEDKQDEFFWKYRNHIRDLFINQSCEVIGSIYENPELLNNERN